MDSWCFLASQLFCACPHVPLMAFFPQNQSCVKLTHPFLTGLSPPRKIIFIVEVWLLFDAPSSSLQIVLSPSALQAGWITAGCKNSPHALATSYSLWYSPLHYLSMVTPTFRIQLRHHACWKGPLTTESEFGASLFRLVLATRGCHALFPGLYLLLNCALLIWCSQCLVLCLHGVVAQKPLLKK